MNTANKLTILRVILIPVYLVVWYLNFAGNNFVVFPVSEFSTVSFMRLFGFFSEGNDDTTVVTIVGFDRADFPLTVSYIKSGITVRHHHSRTRFWIPDDGATAL